MLLSLFLMLMKRFIVQKKIKIFSPSVKLYTKKRKMSRGYNKKIDIFSLPFILDSIFGAGDKKGADVLCKTIRSVFFRN